MRSNLSDYERFLKPVHLKGEAKTFTIVKFTEEKTHPQKGEERIELVAWFREVPFGFILSPTNRKTLYETCDELAGWIGKPITVKAIAIGKVGKTDRSPIRITNTRPNAPKIEPSTGEIVPAETAATEAQKSVTYSAQPERVIQTGSQQPAASSEPPLSPEGEAELEKYFGPNPRVPSEQPTTEAWPTTEAEYTEWTKRNGINGKETYSALGESAASWMRKNRKGWADVAKTVHATLGK
jgi:hypothetical protein